MTATIQRSFPGKDDITRIVLPNGITILIRANHNSPSVVIGGYIVCGSLFDPDEKLGLAAFTADALLRGSRKRTFQIIFDCLESAGANRSAYGRIYRSLPGRGPPALIESPC
jgi:zinc protease